jgi:hypothetical protein
MSRLLLTPIRLRVAARAVVLERHELAGHDDLHLVAFGSGRRFITVSKSMPTRLSAFTYAAHAPRNFPLTFVRRAIG